jgi:hypothetical protein
VENSVAGATRNSGGGRRESFEFVVGRVRGLRGSEFRVAKVGVSMSSNYRGRTFGGDDGLWARRQ